MSRAPSRCPLHRSGSSHIPHSGNRNADRCNSAGTLWWGYTPVGHTPCWYQPRCHPSPCYAPCSYQWKAVGDGIPLKRFRPLPPFPDTPSGNQPAGLFPFCLSRAKGGRLSNDFVSGGRPPFSRCLPLPVVANVSSPSVHPHKRPTFSAQRKRLKLKPYWDSLVFPDMI